MSKGVGVWGAPSRDPTDNRTPNSASVTAMENPARPFRVYFIDDGTAVKIGIALDPLARLDALQTGNPRRLDLIGSIEGDLGDERVLHDRFAAHRLVGEWFDRRPVREWLGLDHRPAPEGVDKVRAFLSESTEEATQRSIFQRFHSSSWCRQVAQLEAILEWLEDNHEITRTKRIPDGGGRPTVVVTKN